MSVNTEPADRNARPLRRDAARNRERLLEAAREVFAEAGFEASMDEVAARAGVGVGTAYRRFANKDELITALFQDRLAEVTEAAGQGLAEEDPWQGVVTYMERSIELQAADRGLKEMFFSSPHSRQFVARARAQLEPRVAEIVARAHRAGVLRPGTEPTDLVIAQLMLAAIADGAGENSELWRRFLPLLLAGLGPSASDPLPGRALSPDQLDALMEGPHRPLR